MKQVKEIVAKVGIACAVLMYQTSGSTLWAKSSEDDPVKNLLLELPNTQKLPGIIRLNNKKEETDTVFKPKLRIGALVHMYAAAQQDGYSNTQADDLQGWNKGFAIHRTRILLGGELSSKGSFFIETELPSSIGTINADHSKNVKVSQILLDAQYQYVFTNSFQLIAGKQLVSNNRNGLQAAGALLTGDFSASQYRYNMYADSPLQGDFGRDLGVNARGFLFQDRLEYRMGVFTGRMLDGKDPLRYVGRLAYNFLEKDLDYYYTGTSLGSRKLLTWGAGFDTQSSYQNYSTDIFLDYPLHDQGALSLNAAFQYMTGGTSDGKYSFAKSIPQQTVQFLELGYYFKRLRLQPWIKYEHIAVSAKAEQSGDLSPADFNKQQSGSLYGAGLNYFFDGLRANLRFSYLAKKNQLANTQTEAWDAHTFGQYMLQLQFAIF